jgi:hypothetical protein
MQISSGNQRTAKTTYNALPLRHKPHYIRLVETLSPYIYLHISCQKAYQPAIGDPYKQGATAMRPPMPCGGTEMQGSYSGIGRMQLK